MNDPEYKVLTFDVREENDDLVMLLPEPDELDAVIGTSKWMVRQATAEMFGRGGAGQVEIVGPGGPISIDTPGSSCTGGPSCGDKKLDW
jgi:nitrite reductase (NAD(P)H)